MDTRLNGTVSTLRIAIGLMATLAGLDKFFNLLTNWEQYLAPSVSNIVPAHTFMMIVGIIEIVAGLVVLFKPRFGGYLVAVWMWGIILNLLLIPGFFDIALRDLGLSLGALALARLAEAEATVHATEPRMATARA